MIKSKAFIFLVAAIFFNTITNSASFASEDTGMKSRYPDYACEFTGKDTCEKFNRKMFIFNLKVNKYIIRPINIVWASVMPQYGMDRIKNVYTNSTFPVRLVGCLLQKDFESSKTETIRFLTNTTMGIGGLYDPALTKYKIEPRNEDVEQALAHLNIKKGPYIVLPVVAQGNLRDLAGKALDCPLNPTSYVLAGPVAAIVTGVSLVNNTTYMQPLANRIDYTYPDPYEISKQLWGIERYIKNSNLDRSEVLAEKTALQNIIKINNTYPNLKADVKLENFNPQCPLVDSMRTAIFDNQKIDKHSKWAELSVWNKNFNKQIKTDSVTVYNSRAEYKYRYILQKNKTAPLAVIYPSFGEGIMADKSRVLAKMLYDEGYSVAIQGSSFQWEFVKSMPEGYKPGLPPQDAYYLGMTTSKIIDDLEKKNKGKFDKKIIVGCSFGALTALFVTEQDEKNATGMNLGISNCIAINPPVEIFFALKQLDKYSQDWKNDPTDIKLRTAITAQKIIQFAGDLSAPTPSESKKIAKWKKENNNELTDSEAEKPVSVKIESRETPLPFTNEEAKLTIGFIMKQKLSDVVFTIENGSKCKKNPIYDTILDMSFQDYAQKYLISEQSKPIEELTADSSMQSLSGFLQNSDKYKIYHTLDDYFVNREQLIWLKNQTQNKSVLYSNGSHLGCMYRPEFMEAFKNEIKINKISPRPGL